MFVNSSQTQHDRLQAFEKVRTLGLRVVICTDILARGIDLPDVRLVVNLDAAKTQEEYLHRAGRASRWAHNPGLVVNFEAKGLQTSIEDVSALIKELLKDKDSLRVETRLTKETAISDLNVKTIEYIERCEQTYKRQKLESGEAKVG